MSVYFLFLLALCFVRVFVFQQEIESMQSEMSVLDTQIVETKDQVKPYEAARQQADRAHKVTTSGYCVGQQVTF